MVGTSAGEQKGIDWLTAHEALSRLARQRAAETEHEWLELAVGKTVRQLEELVAGKQLGDMPSAAPDPSALRHVPRFEVTAATFALVREALAELRRRSDSALNDDAALLEMARHVLVGPRDEGRASYQIALSLCPACSRAHQSANEQLVSVGPDVVEKAECDAQHLPPLDRDIMHAHVDTTHTHVGTRAKQNTPPAVRRAVMQRDHHRCRVPGCRNATFLDVHHLRLRSDGGAHVAANLIAVCSAHHDALHRGQLHTEGDADAVRFLHADGRDYGQPQQPRSIEVQTKVFAGLRLHRPKLVRH